jgi:hypothetical protein
MSRPAPTQVELRGQSAAGPTEIVRHPDGAVYEYVGR